MKKRQAIPMDAIAITFPGIKDNARMEHLNFNVLKYIILKIFQYFACKNLENAMSTISKLL